MLITALGHIKLTDVSYVNLSCLHNLYDNQNIISISVWIIQNGFDVENNTAL